MADILERGAAFVWSSGRLIDRRLLELRFYGGEPAALLAALLAYQNADGGFGQALEPDLRCPGSQPVPTQHALEYAEAAGLGDALAQRVCNYLETISGPGGGVPFVLPSAHPYPRAPWWQAAEGTPESLNPTAALAGMLIARGVRHRWVERAEAFCRARIPHAQAEEMHDLACILTFLRHAPDRAWAEAQLARLWAGMRAGGMVAEPGAEGYVRTALDWAPDPAHPLRAHIPPDEIAACLGQLAARQQADGGWPIAWPAPGAAAELEWRGWLTVMNIWTLHTNGVAVR